MQLILDPVNGDAVWLLADGRTLKQAGSKDKEGYVCIRCNGRVQKLHRLIYKSVHGRIPDGMQIDHINGVKDDNRITNLRVVSNKLNAQNRQRAHANNKLGIKGVSWKAHIRKYVAQICVDGKVKHLGSFTSVEEAAKAYARAAAKVHTNNPTAKGE